MAHTSMIFSAAIAAMLMAAAPAPSAGSTEILSVLPCEFGEAAPWSTVECTYVVTNVHEVPVALEIPSTAQRTVQSSNLPVRIDAGESATVDVSFRLEGSIGRRGLQLPLQVAGLEAADAPPLVLRAHGFVYSILDDASPAVDFGVVKAGTRPTRSYQLLSHDVADLRAAKILSKPDFVDVELAEDGHAIKISMRADVAWGLQTGAVHMGLNSAAQPEAAIMVEADVHGKVVPNTNPVNLGVLRKDGNLSALVRLTQADGGPIKLGDIALDGLQASVHRAPCAEDTEACVLLRLDISDDEPTGNLASTMHIALPDFSKSLTVGLTGVLLNADTKIRDLEQVLDGAENKSSGGTPTPGSASLTGALASMTHAKPEAPLPPPEPAGDGPVLRWQVGNQQTIYGFLIYRASAKDGPFLRANDEIIRVIDPNGSNAYAWRDTSATKGETYWYYISTLANNGQKQQLSGAQKVVAD